MPQCPTCNAAVWVGQQYCTTCTNPIPQKEGDDHYCSRCGARLATPDEFCRCSKIPWPEIAWSVSAPPVRGLRLPLRVPDICLGTGLLAAALVLFILFHKNPIPHQLIMAPPPQAIIEQATAPSPTSPAAMALPAPQVKVRETVATSTPAVSSSPEVKTPAPTPTTSAATSPAPVYFVNTVELSVREGPHTSAPRIATLNFEDEVELLETSGGWGKVRNAERNVVGWSYMRYLQPLDADGSQAVSQHRPAVPPEQEPVSAQAPKHM
jgi:hypothetical protein